MAKFRLKRRSALFIIIALNLQAIWAMVIQNMPSQYLCTSPYYYLPFDDLPTTEKNELCGYLTDSILYRIKGTDALKCVGGVPSKVSGYTKFLSHALCMKQNTQVATPSGSLTCPTNYRLVTKIEATNQNAQICAQITQWAILLIGGGSSATPSIRGSGYSCVITDPDSASMTQVLCTQVILQIISANESGCPASQIYVYSSSPTCRSSCPASYLQDEIYCNLVCDTSCATCSGPSSTECLTCQSGLFMLPDNSCLYPCPDGYYPTSTHCLPCDSTCKTCSGPLATDCILCKTNLYKYPNSVCLSSCSSTFATTIPTYPLYCNYPCISTTNLAFINGTCTSSCPSPFSFVANANPVCSFPCDLNSYLYPDGSCRNRCEVPFSIQSEGGNGYYCKPPCPNANEYYISDSNTCDASCSFPSTEVSLEFYKLCKSSTNPNLLETASEVRNITGKAYTIISLVASALSFGSCGILTSNIASEMFEYIKYINVTHSADLELIIVQGQTSFVNLNINIDLPEHVEDKMTSFPIPAVLSKYGLVSNFFMNLWQSVFWWGVTILCIIILQMCEQTKNKKRRKLVRKLRIMVQNFLLTLFYNVIGDIIFFGILELRYNQDISGYSLISFALAIISIVVLIIVLAMHCLFLHKRQKLRTSSQNKSELSKKFEMVQMLFQDFKNDFIVQEGALLVIILREILFKAILVTLYRYPLMETILIVILECLMIAYFLLIRPFESIFDAAQIIFCELVLLIANVGLCISAVSDWNDSSASIETVGQIIIILALSYNIEALGYSVTKMLLTLKELIQSWRKRQTLKVLNRTLSSSRMISLSAMGPLVSTQRDGVSRTRERGIETNKTSDFTVISESDQNISGVNMSTLQLTNETSMISRLETIHTTPINVSRRNRLTPFYPNHQSLGLNLKNEPENKRRAR